MNCYLHPETPAVAFCRTCGRSLCTVCQRPLDGTIFCQDHVPVSAYTQPGTSRSNVANPYYQQSGVPPTGAVRTSPGLAFALGLIPGVGAIYNGQYLKGLLHALIFGLLVTITDNSPASSDALMAMLITAFVAYMPFEAFHTAKKREMGILPDEWSSILPRGNYARKAPVGPILLIVIGVLYLLSSLNLVDFRQVGRFWPVILILVGAYMLYARVASPSNAAPAPEQPITDARTAADDFAGKQHE